MKIEVDQKDIDRLLGKRVAEFNKQIRDLKGKLDRRDKQIQKLKHEVEKLKGDMMETERGTAVRIAQLAESLVVALEGARWVARHHECENNDPYCNCHDFY